MRGRELGRSDDGKTEQPSWMAASFSGPATVAQGTAGDLSQQLTAGAWSFCFKKTVICKVHAWLLSSTHWLEVSHVATPIATASRTNYHLKSPTSKSSLLTNAESSVS